MSKHPEYSSSIGFGADLTDDAYQITIALIQIYDATEKLYIMKLRRRTEKKSYVPDMAQTHGMVHGKPRMTIKVTINWLHSGST